MKRLLLLVLAVALLAACSSAREDDRETSPEPGAAAVAGSCVERYAPERVAAREFAFDGVVTAIHERETSSAGESLTAGTVTFRVNRWFKGAGSPSVMLRSAVPLAPGAVSSVDFPAIAEGGRYLVSGEDETMWGCGFTREYSVAEAGAWAQAISP